MCTLIVFDRVVPGFPLVVGSNRDEYYARPSQVPIRLDSRDGLNPSSGRSASGENRPPIVAPQDLLAGGTWMGINAGGLFVGLTNRRTDSQDPEARSRGQLVLDALGAPSTQQARQAVDPMYGDNYNPYFLLLADGRETLLLSEAGDGQTAEELSPGIHVIGNLPPGHPEGERIRWIEDRAAKLPIDAGLEPVFEGMREILGTHLDVLNPREGACVHTPLFGTRSSSLIALGDKRWEWHHSEGPACEAKFDDLSRLSEELRLDASWRDAGAHETHRESIRYTGNA